MHTHGIKVLDRADNDAVIVAIANHLHLIFFPTDERLINKKFVSGREVKTANTDCLKFLSVVGDTAARSTHREGGSDNAGETDILKNAKGLFERMRQGRPRGFQTDSFHRLIKKLSILCLINRFLGGANHLDPILLKDTLRSKLERAVERRLSTHRRQDGIGPFALNDPGNCLPFDRLDVGGVGHGGVGHDGGRVGVNQNHPVALLSQRLAGLRARVIKLTGLTDDDGSRAQNQNAFNVGAFWHQASPPERLARCSRMAVMKESKRGAASWGPGLASGCP